MANPIQFRRATRSAVKLKIGIDGPSGSGKTEGALAVATGITEGGRIAVADTENESASYYADRYDFDTLGVPNADADVLSQVIRLAVAEKYDALVIDSMSHAWLRILQAKDLYMLDNPRANGWTTWGLPQFGPRWEELMKLVLDAPIHVIATMRSKQAYEQVTHDGGKKEVVKLGLQPQVREGAEYEFGLVFSVNMAHRAEATKDRTRLFPLHTLVDLCDPKVHKSLIKWMNSETPATIEAIEKLIELSKHPIVGDITRRAVHQLVESGTPGAGKVAKWTEQLEKHIGAPLPAASNANPEQNGSGDQTAAAGAPRELF